MAALVRLPKLGANLVEGTVGLWRKREGDPLRAGEPLVEIITSKATFEVPSPADGTLRKVLAPEKSNVPIGYVLAVVGAPDEALPDVASENAQLVAAFRGQAALPAAEGTPVEGPPSPVVRATPSARRLAREAGISLADLPAASGRDVIREEDVRRYLAETRGA